VNFLYRKSFVDTHNTMILLGSDARISGFVDQHLIHCATAPSIITNAYSYMISNFIATVSIDLEENILKSQTKRIYLFHVFML
jgi:hypothetical protein